MIEAMYGVEFLSDQWNRGYGVAILETGRIFGGDASFVYIGEYEVKNNIVYAQVKITNDREILESIFGDYKEFNLELEGKLDSGDITLSGHMVENPSLIVGILLTRRAELP